jgi:NAD+ kinase
MKIWIETCLDKSEILKILQDANMHISKSNPDFIIVYGGDGTILQAEKKYPGIPKIPLYRELNEVNKREKTYKSYRLEDLKTLLDKVDHGEYKLRVFQKIEAIYKHKKLRALNEIQIHNKDPRKALRFSLQIGTKRIENIIGDGVVAATPFGSFAYYRALGNEPFKNGFRIGFNNVFPKKKPIEIPKNSFAIIKIEREIGLLIADNSEMLEIKPGETVEIRPSKNTAKFVELPTTTTKAVDH